jgi:uncharacterized protein YukE
MEQNVKLTPQALLQITSEMDKIRDKIKYTASELKNQATSIASIWNDEQSERFLDSVSGILKRLDDRMQEVETEKNRVVDYQKRTDAAAKNANK